MPTISIATEDALSEAVATRLVNEYTNFTIDLTLGRKGNGHLKSNLKSYFEISQRAHLLLITDLDSVACSPALITKWERTVNIQRQNNFLFRVAVREIESWLIADHDSMEALLRARNLTNNPDRLDDPKNYILKLALKAPKETRENLLLKVGDDLSQGLGYNSLLSQFVFSAWEPQRARQRSNSLDRTCRRLEELANN